MNSSVYIFGELSSGYTQYPEDSSSYVLKTLYRHCKAPTQIVIHRDGSLMHYCYVRKLDNDKYFGFCIAVNGYYISNIDVLFALFENTMEKVVSQGVLIHFSENGTLTTSIGTLRSEEEELESLTENLRIGFEGFRKISKPLPRTDYGIAKDSIKEHCISDGMQDIVRASYSYGFTYVYKDEDYDTVRMNSYRGVLSRLNEENKALKEKNLELQEENKKVLHQKKQYRYVLILMIMILGCGVGLFFLYNNLNSTQELLTEANITIIDKDNDIKRLNASRDSLELCLIDEKQEKRELEKNLSAICTSVPFVITSCSINAEEVVVDYYAVAQKDVTVYLKAINESESEIVSNSHSVTIYKGKNKLKLSFNYRLNIANYYYVNIIYDGHVIGGGRW